MFKTKYLIIIGIIICVVIIYYFYNEISTMKKLLLPTYRKTSHLEQIIQDLGEKQNSPPSIKKEMSKIDSPIYSISYQSDIKNGIGRTTSVKFIDLSETEVERLFHEMGHKNKTNSPTKSGSLSKNSPSKDISRLSPTNSNSNSKNKSENIKKPVSPNSDKLHYLSPSSTSSTNKKYIMESGDFSDYMSNERPVNKINPCEDTDTISVKISDILHKNTSLARNDKGENKVDGKEYHNILQGLSKSASMLNSDIENTTLNFDMKTQNLSESICISDIHSDPIITELSKSHKHVNKKHKQ